MEEGLAPAAFIGHGSPMNALEQNRFTEAWRAFGSAAGSPRAVIAVSAHWFVNATAVTAMRRPRTIHDFYGFPDELSAVEYPAPGSPEVAAEVVDALAPHWVGLDHDSWGIDHGTWSVLVHAFPAADVPVVQLSVHAAQPVDYHVDLGAKLAALRRSGVVVVASGNVVHNLGRIDWSRPEGAFDWARRFDEAARHQLLDDPSALATLTAHPDFARAAPTPDHFLPLAYLAGMAAADGEAPEVLVDGYAYGSLSMAGYTLGLPGGPGRRSANAEGNRAAGLPDPSEVPADETNL
ncbi:MAG: 4,5-DOPA-extradiol-dioxygenase [Acidimicrobiales bacterium]